MKALYVKKTTLLNIIITIMLYSFFVYSYYFGKVKVGWSHTVSWAACILFIYHINRIVKLKVRIYDFRAWFVLLQYIFIFGRIWLNGMGLDKDIFWNLFLYYDHTAMYLASLYGLVYTQAIFTGFFLFYKPTINPYKKESSSVGKQFYRSGSMTFIGVGLILISLPFRIYNDILTILAQSSSAGYVAVAVTNGMMYAFGMLLPVGVIYLIYSDSLRKHTIRIILVLWLVYTTIVMIFSGDRRYSIIAIIVVILCFLVVNDVRIGLGKTILGIVTSFLVLTVLATIRNGRMYVIDSFSVFFDIFIETLVKSNLLYETFAEFGLTFFIYASVFQFFPTVIPFKYGLTYLLAPITTIPMIGVVVPNLQTSISGHLDAKSITGHPLGAALGQELYCNFGLLAPLFAVFAGYLLNRVMNFNSIKSSKHMARYFGLFYILLNLVRSSTTEILRMAVYSLVIPVILEAAYKLLLRSASKST